MGVDDPRRREAQYQVLAVRAYSGDGGPYQLRGPRLPSTRRCNIGHCSTHERLQRIGPASDGMSFGHTQWTSKTQTLRRRERANGDTSLWAR